MQVAFNTVGLSQLLQAKQPEATESGVLQWLQQHRVDWKQLLQQTTHQVPLLVLFAIKPALCTDRLLKYIFDTTDAREAIDVRVIDGASRTQNCTALSWAAANDNPGLIRALVSYGADVSVVSSAGHTVLHTCVEHRSFNAFETCMDCKLYERVDLNAATHDTGDTLLHLFASRCQQPVSTLLLMLQRLPVEHIQINPNVVNHAGHTPADVIRLKDVSQLEIDTFINYMNCLHTAWVDFTERFHACVHLELGHMLPLELLTIVVAFAQ